MMQPNWLRKIDKEGLFNALEKGIFADIKRPNQMVAKVLAGVVEKGSNYFNPYIEILHKK